MGSTLLWGTANPEGVATGGSIYLNGDDIRDMIAQVDEASRGGAPLPVHMEHKGIPIGHVVSAWEHNGMLECVLSLNDRVLEGSIGSEFVRKGFCKDLSLGYLVSLENSGAGMKVKKKFLTEISVVKKGARSKCHIHGVT